MLHFPAVEFSPLKRKKVVAEPGGGDITSDGGVLLVREADRHLGLMQAVNGILVDSRSQGKVLHSQLSLLRQRWIEKRCPLLSRLERRFDRGDGVRIHEILVDQFIASFKRPPKEPTLDFDATDDRVHGQQEGRLFQNWVGGGERSR